MLLFEFTAKVFMIMENYGIHRSISDIISRTQNRLKTQRTGTNQSSK